MHARACMKLDIHIEQLKQLEQRATPHAATCNRCPAAWRSATGGCGASTRSWRGSWWASWRQTWCGGSTGEGRSIDA
jgi:hypothetical protein